MGAAGLIDRPAEASSPAGVMKADPAVEGHPVGYRRGIALSPQRGVPLLIGQRIRAARCGPASGFIAGYKVCFHQELSVFIKIQMLGSQIDLHICTAVIIGPAAGSLLAVFRLPGLLLSVFYDGEHRRRLRRLADLPAVMASGDGHILSVGRFQGLCFIGCVILSRQFLYVSGRLAFIQGDVSSVHCDPLADGISVQHFPGIPKGMGHHRAHIPVHLCCGRVEPLVCLIHRRFCITALCIQVHLI